MNWEIAIAIVSLLAALYPILVGQETLQKKLPDIFRNPLIKRLFWALAATGVISLLFLAIIVPRSQVVLDWVRVGDESFPEREKPAEPPLILHFDPDRSVYAPAQLISADTYPTTLAIASTPEKKAFYVGTYGAGIFASDNLPDWRSLGLENMVVTAVRTNERGELIVATNLGIFVTTDDGVTWERKGSIHDLVTTLVLDPNSETNWFAGTLNGFYRSTDYGNTWVGPYIEGEVVTAIEFSPMNSQRMYAALLGGAILRSDDGGESWSSIRSSDQEGSVPLAVDASDMNTVYIGPGKQGLYRTLDAGQSWSYLGLEGASISSIVVSSIAQGMVAVGTDSGHGIFTSLDNGETWQNYSSVYDQILSIVEDTTIPGTLVATTKRSGLITSSNFGRTWTSMGLQQSSSTTLFSIRDMFIFPNDPTHLFAISVTHRGVFESNDGGQNWSLLPGLEGYQNVEFQKFTGDRNDSNHLFLSGVGGLLLETVDGGKTWSPVTGNLPREGYAPVTLASDGTIYAGPSNEGVWMRPQGQLDWKPTGLSSFSIRNVWVTNDGTRIGAFDESGRLHYSRDAGTTWAVAPYQFESLAADRNDANLLVGITENYEVLRSVDAGKTWAPVISIPSSADIFGARVQASNDRPARFYLTSAESLKVSLDAGETWQEATLPDAGLLFASTFGQLYFFGNGTFYSSIDYGQTWVAIQSDTVVESSARIFILDDSTHLAATTSKGMLISTDAGETWSQTSIGPEVGILDMTIVDGPSGQQLVGLVRNQGNVSIILSSDGKLWEPLPLPCEASSGILKPVIGHDGQERWQVHCGKQNSVIAVSLSPLRWDVIPLPPTLPSYVTDARLESAEVAYILTGSSGDQTVHVTLDRGRNWISGGVLAQEVRWELAHDLRGEAVLVSRDGDVIVGSYRSRLVTATLTYLAWLVYSLVALLYVFVPSVLTHLYQDVQRVMYWFFSPTLSLEYKRLHKAYPWIIWPLLVLTALLIVQVVPLNSITATVLLQTLNNPIIEWLVTLTLTLPISLTTINGVIFLALVLITTVQVASLAGVIVLLGNSIDYFRSKKAESPQTEVLIIVTSMLFLDALVLAVIGLLPTTYPGSVGPAFGFELIDVFNLFRLYIFFQITSLSLDIVSQRMGVSPVVLALTYLGVTILLAILALNTIAYLLPTYPETGQELAQTLPLNTFAIVNALLLTVYIGSRWYRRRLQLSRA